MKPFYLMIIFLCLTSSLRAQVTKTVDVIAGSLEETLTDDELSTITNLSVTGILDDRDFLAMYDKMPLLAEVDLSRAIIGSMHYDGTTRPTNALPRDVFAGKTSLVSVILPMSTISIRNNAFKDCIGLKSITIPSMTDSVSNSAFEGCTSLSSIFVNARYPFKLNAASDVWKDVDKANCTLFVPSGTKHLYEIADKWKEFAHIVEMVVFHLSKDQLFLTEKQGATETVTITSTGKWSAKTDQTWLKLSPASGTGNDTLAISADANTGAVSRTATVTVTFSDIVSRTILVIQPGIPKTVTVTAGMLNEMLTKNELDSTTYLVVNGTIDARDFNTITSQMPLLSILDLSKAIVVYYENEEYGLHSEDDKIPSSALSNGYWYNSKLNKVILPTSTIAIGNSAFSFDRNLKEVIIPESVTSIGDEAFYYCMNLTGIDISSVEILGKGVFCCCSSLTSVKMSSSLTSIGSNTFAANFSLNSVTIPSSVTNIGEFAFGSCNGLSSIYANSMTYPIGPSIVNYR